MSFDYLKDLFGRFRRHETKFSDVERRAFELLFQYSQGVIDKNSFGEQMERVSKDFQELMFDESGNIVFDEDTPCWLNLFLGNKFSSWNHVRKLINAAKDNPEVTSSPKWPEVLNIMKQENRELMDAIKYCLEGNKQAREL